MNLPPGLHGVIGQISNKGSCEIGRGPEEAAERFVEGRWWKIRGMRVIDAEIIEIIGFNAYLDEHR